MNTLRQVTEVAAPRLGHVGAVFAGVQRGAAQLYVRCKRILPRPQRELSVLAPLVCAFFAVRANLTHGLEPLQEYDEALLFTNAFLMNHGSAIYRDFYSNYPPGVMQVVRAVMLLGWPPIWSVRLLGFLVHFASAAMAGYLVGRVQAKPLCLSTLAIVLILQSGLGLTPYAYCIAVLLAQICVAVWSHASLKPAHAVLSGVLLGVLSYFRHDLFVYSLALFGPLEVVWVLSRKQGLFLRTRRQLLFFGAAAYGTVLVLWWPVIARAGISRVVHDLVIDQAQRVQPGRMLPFPPLSGYAFSQVLNIKVPEWAASQLAVCLLLAACATAAALPLAARSLKTSPPTRETRLCILLCGFAVATLPQALQRTDYGHAAYGVPLTAAVLFASLGPRINVLALMVALLPWFVHPRAFIGSEDLARMWQRRADSTFQAPERARLAHFIQAETTPDEPIYAGCTSHKRIILNPLDVYYWAPRKGATRYMQFDPGTVTSPDGQQEMIADLERTRPRIALLKDGCAWFEPNASAIEGATLLDDYLHAHYDLTGQLGAFQLLRRRGL